MKNDLDRKSAMRRSSLISKGIYIDFPSPTTFKGKSVWALGSRLYPNESIGISFHEFIINALAQELGKEWIQMQKGLPENERHFIIKSHDRFIDWLNKSPKNKLEGEEHFSAIPDGWTKSLISLAFDIACIIHVHGYVPPKIIGRLKLKDSNYQGARYEIAIAAFFARMGCKFRFLDEELDHLKLTPGHNEFIATDTELNTSVVVEAKSKVRKGVLHELDSLDPLKLWTNITGPFTDALKEIPADLPYLVFVDMNCPPTPELPLLERPWAKQVLEQRKRNPNNNPTNPDPCSGIVYTNYSYHYQFDNEARSGEALLIVPNYSRYVLPELFILKMQNTLNGFSAVPNFNYDGSVSF